MKYYSMKSKKKIEKKALKSAAHEIFRRKYCLCCGVTEENRDLCCMIIFWTKQLQRWHSLNMLGILQIEKHVVIDIVY